MKRHMPLLSLLLLASTGPLQAKLPSAPFYRADPIVAPSGRVAVVSDVIWSQSPDGLTAAEARSRPEVVGARLVRSVGQLRAFSAGDQPFDTDRLASCNARAR